MNTLIYLIPIALFLGGIGLVAFLWALKAASTKTSKGLLARARRW